ncbi:MAG: ACP S-malonyltransferase [Bacteroidales bacterium]|nr:ACP S-malonyltransferase [Bacteroidales bacterium]MBQ2194956.1 ACP S-malonyltransferase [Bacteroidales bacterium]
MKKAYVFPGQGSQFTGMGHELYVRDPEVRDLFDAADSLLGFGLREIMFEGKAEDLKATRVTQPALFLHSVAAARYYAIKPDMVAGHSLGEFSALVAAGALSFEDGLKLVSARAQAMQRCCEATPGAMAAILGAPAELVEEVCAATPGTVVPANYNNDGQLVISGEVAAVQAACATLKERGVKRALLLPVGGAFHSPLMEPARQELAEAISAADFHRPVCPIYQNVDALPHTDPDEIRSNLLMQLTSPVRWTQTVKNMVADGAGSFTEVGAGTVLQGLVRKIAPEVEEIAGIA